MSSVEAWFSTALDIEEVLSGAGGDQLHVIVADVIESFDTVDRSILDGALGRIGLPSWFRKVHFSSHSQVTTIFSKRFPPWSPPRDGGWLGIRDVPSAPHLLDDGGKVIKRVGLTRKTRPSIPVHGIPDPGIPTPKRWKKIAFLTRCQSLARQWRQETTRRHPDSDDHLLFYIRVISTTKVSPTKKRLNHC